MTETSFVKIQQKQASEITGLFELSEDGKALLTDGISPADFLQLLIGQENYADAINFMAYALPKREAVWWACLCARSCQSSESNPLEAKAIELAEAWVYKPTQENCTPTFTAAEAIDFKTAAGWAAISAFWSGDNISPIKDNIVKPAADLTAKATSGSVMLAMAQDGPELINEKAQRFIRQAIDIAAGGDGRKVE